MRDCIKRLVEKSKGAINVEAAKEILNTVDREARKRVNSGFDYDDAVSQVIAERMANTKVNIAKQKANMAKNVIVKAKMNDKISKLIDAGLSTKEAFLADLEGIVSHIAGTKDSLDIAKNAVENAYFSKLIGELNNEDLMPIFTSKQLNDEIGKELHALSYKEKSVTQSKEARRIAEIIHEVREGQRLRLNKAGADIGEVGGYIMPQRPDTFEMHKAGEDEWVTFMLPLIDEKRSFGGDYDDLETAMRAAYKAMVSGIRLNDPLDKNAKLFQFNGVANLAKRLSQQREIHFKDYASWKKWNDTYGMKDLNEGVIDAIRFDAHNIATLERYGTNPEVMMQTVLGDIKKKYRDKIAKEGELGIDSKIQSAIDGVLGKNMIPANPNLARIGSNIRTFQNVTKLGGVLLSSIADIPMKSLEYQHQGKNWLSASVQPYLDIVNSFQSKKDKTEFASMVGVGFEGLIGDIGGRFSANDSLSNKASKVQRMFFKLNGLSWWTDSHQMTMGKVMSHHLGLKKATEFDKLDADTKRLFGNYNITKSDWDIMRTSVSKMDDGRDYLLPEFIQDEKLKEKLIGYYFDRVNTGIITPSAREQRLATFGTQRGTPVGEAVRLMMQFKSFPITMITKVWGRALYGKGKMDIPAMVYLMMSTMVYGYIAGAAKDLVKNKTPKDPMKLETVYASLAQGGGIGILGDVLLQDGSGFGRSFSQTLAGPTFGTLDDIFRIYSAGIRGGGSKRQAFKTGIGVIPFNNLFYTRAALDQMILLQMQEDMNRGYLRRMEQNMKNTYGQELLFK